MKNKNEQKLKSDKLHLWHRWEKECQYLILFSALAAGMVEPVSAQSTDVADGTIQNTPVTLNEDGAVLNNNGTIAVTGAGSTTVDSSANNTVINNGTAGGTGIISGDSRAVDITSGSGATINNAAGSEILATGDQRNGTVYVDSDVTGVTLNNDGSIDASAVQGAGVSAELSAAGNTIDINNTGTIAGGGSAAAGSTIAGDGIRLERTRVSGALDATTTGIYQGTITNSAGASITSDSTDGTTAGIRTVNGVSFQGTLNNEGTISGAQNGVYLGNAVGAGGADHTGGVVNNSGTISSDSRALNIDGTGVEVNNTGDIVGTGDQRNGTVYADSTAQDFTLNNDGVIDAGEGNLGAGFSTELSAEGNNFDINNTGTIQGRGVAGAGLTTAGDGVRFERTRVDGALDATTSGLFTGNITNSGTIDSEGDSGTTAGVRFVNGVSFNGTIDNQEGGVISGVQNGLYFGNATPAGGGDFTGAVVNNAGIISSGSRALNIDGTGLTVNNSGQILGTGDQRNGTVYVDGTFNDVTINNQANGVIDAGEGNNGSGISIEVDVNDTARTAEINNDGTIQGRGTGSTAGIRIFGVDIVALANVDITNGLEGSIISDNEAGILVEGVGYSGTITNNGIISGATAAIDTTTATGDITINQGTGSLEGGVFTGIGDDVLNITDNANITGDIDLGAGNNSINISSNGVANIEAQAINNSDLNVDGTLGINLKAPFSVDGTTTFTEGSTIDLNVDNIASLDLTAPTTILTADSVIGAENVEIVEDSLLVDFEPAEQTPDTVQVQASSADLTQQFDDANVLSLGQALQAGLGVNNDLAFAQIVNQIDGVGSAQFEAISAELLPDLSSGVTREFYENQSSTFNSIERQLAQANQANSFWFQASGRSADRDGGSNVTDTGYESDSFGFILGYGKSINSNLNVGAALSYSDIEVDAGFTSTDVEAYSLNLYSQYTEGNFFVRGAAAYSFGDAESSRNTQFGAIDSDSDIDQFSAKLSVGVDKTLGRHKFSPFASLEYSNISRDGFTENGGLGLSVSDDDLSILELGVGVSHEIDLNPGARAVKLVSRVGYYYDVLDEETSVDARINGGSSFNLDGSSISQGSLEFATGLGFSLSDSSTLSFGYEGNFASDFDSHTGYLRFKKEF